MLDFRVIPRTVNICPQGKTSHHRSFGPGVGVACALRGEMDTGDGRERGVRRRADRPNGLGRRRVWGGVGTKKKTESLVKLRMAGESLG